jgi:iron complex outermembrane receptor protein
MSHLNRISDLWAVQADVQLTYRQYRVWDEAFIGTQFSKPYYFANPRIGITFRPEQSWSGFASLALAHREPRMKSLYDGEEAGAGFEPLFNMDAQGNLDMDKPFIKPERLIDLELGTRWSGEKFRASANVFVMDFQDEIVPSGGLDQYGVPRTGNADRTRHIGLEMEGAVRLAPGLDLAGNATISRNRFISFAEFVTLPDFSTTEIDRASNPIAGFPATSGNMRLDYSKKGFSASIMSSLVGTQYVDNGEGENASGLPQEDLKLEAYMLVDASISYLFSSTGKFAGLKLGLDLNNVLNDEVLTYGNVSFGATQFFPAATRHAFFSARYTLK